MGCGRSREHESLYEPLIGDRNTCMVIPGIVIGDPDTAMGRTADVYITVSFTGHLPVCHVQTVLSSYYRGQNTYICCPDINSSALIALTSAALTTDNPSESIKYIASTMSIRPTLWVVGAACKFVDSHVYDRDTNQVLATDIYYSAVSHASSDSILGGCM
jgi:hypothetical protein